MYTINKDLTEFLKRILKLSTNNKKMYNFLYKKNNK